MNLRWHAEAFLKDYQAIWAKDPAANHWLEVLTCYPGLQALAIHRVANGLHRAGVPVLPRMISQLSRGLTGIEIHPGARIAPGVFIDHGMGVVVGETAEVGTGVLLYQGVTLGGTSLSPGKRHPTLEPGVVVGSGAKILGNFTVGANSFVGSGSVVTKPVPEGGTVVGIPGRLAAIHGKKLPSQDLDHGCVPDPVLELVAGMQDRMRQLEAEVDRLRAEVGTPKA